MDSLANLWSVSGHLPELEEEIQKREAESVARCKRLRRLAGLEGLAAAFREERDNEK